MMIRLDCQGGSIGSEIIWLVTKGGEGAQILEEKLKVILLKRHFSCLS